MKIEAVPTNAGPALENGRDIEWWSSFLSSRHPANIHGGQEYIKWRNLENLRCFPRKDPITGEVYASILDYWIAYDESGNKVYITSGTKYSLTIWTARIPEEVVKTKG